MTASVDVQDLSCCDILERVLLPFNVITNVRMFFWSSNDGSSAKDASKFVHHLVTSLMPLCSSINSFIWCRFPPSPYSTLFKMS